VSTFGSVDCKSYIFEKSGAEELKYDIEENVPNTNASRLLKITAIISSHSDRNDSLGCFRFPSPEN
jgi:hypothetical protein